MRDLHNDDDGSTKSYAYVKGNDDSRLLRDPPADPRLRLHRWTIQMIPAIRGTRDIIPGEVERWAFVEATARRVFEQYGYAEIRTPIIEKAELFEKGTGETTDIVQKEMYTFTDKGGERITLRPEATPSLVRAYVEHALEQAMAVPKIYTIGPMFRYERPQKGRYRQFHQLDVEVFGVKDPSIDAEVIDLAWTLIGSLGITGVELAVNSVGCPECRPAFAAALVAALGEDVRRCAATASVGRRPTRCASSTARCPPTSRSSTACRTRWTTSATSAGSTSTRYAGISTCVGIPYTRVAPARPRPRLLHADDVRGAGRPGSARRTPSSAAGGTTAS